MTQTEKDKATAQNAYYEFTGKASDISRQLAFAGFAIIWLFKDSTSFHIPEALFIPLILLGCTLLLDILQYFFLGTSWYIIFKFCKKFDKPIISIIGWFFYVLKIISLIIAYSFMISFIYTQIK